MLAVFFVWIYLHSKHLFEKALESKIKKKKRKPQPTPGPNPPHSAHSHSRPARAHWSPPSLLLWPTARGPVPLSLMRGVHVTAPWLPSFLPLGTEQDSPGATKSGSTPLSAGFDFSEPLFSPWRTPCDPLFHLRALVANLAAPRRRVGSRRNRNGAAAATDLLRPFPARGNLLRGFGVSSSLPWRFPFIQRLSGMRDRGAPASSWAPAMASAVEGSPPVGRIHPKALPAVQITIDAQD